MLFATWVKQKQNFLYCMMHLAVVVYYHLHGKNQYFKIVSKDMLAEYVDTLAPGGGFTYSANIRRFPPNPLYEEKMAIVKDVYYSYARDYYRTH